MVCLCSVCGRCGWLCVNVWRPSMNSTWPCVTCIWCTYTSCIQVNARSLMCQPCYALVGLYCSVCGRCGWLCVNVWRPSMSSTWPSVACVYVKSMSHLLIHRLPTSLNLCRYSLAQLTDGVCLWVRVVVCVSDCCEVRCWSPFLSSIFSLIVTEH